MADRPIVGVVLAAGMSRRLGRPKQLLMLHGEPLAARVVRTCTRSTLDEIIVVGGHEAEAVRQSVATFQSHWVTNPEFASGQASSLVAGLRKAGQLNADALVVLLADQPGIPVEAIDRLVAARRDRRISVGMARYGEWRGHPVLFGSELFGELVEIRGDEGGREIIQRHAGDLELVDGGLDSVPMDIDTDEDYSQYLDLSKNSL